MTDQASVTVDDTRPKTIQWLGSFLFLSGLAIVGMEFFKPELLELIGGPDPRLFPGAIIAIIVGLAINFIGQAMAVKGKAMSFMQGSTNASVRGKEVFSQTIGTPPPPVQPAARPVQLNAEDDLDDDSDDDDDEPIDDSEEESEDDHDEFVADILDKPEWSSAEIVSNTRSSIVPLWLIAIVWNLLAIPLVFVITTFIHDGHWIAVIFYLFPLCGLLFLYLAIRTTIQYRKFGDSKLTLTDKYGTIGGTIAGTVRSDVNIQPLGDYAVTLRCTQKITTGSGKSRHTETKTLHEAKQQISRMSCNALAGIPVSFEIPAGLPESYDDSMRGVIGWTLSLSAPVKGVDYEVEFDVPVVRKRGVKKAESGTPRDLVH